MSYSGQSTQEVNYEALRAAAETIINSTRNDFIPVLPYVASNASSYSSLHIQQQPQLQQQQLQQQQQQQQQLQSQQPVLLHQHLMYADSGGEGSTSTIYQQSIEDSKGVSRARYNFLLFVTFDLMFTGLLWLITVIVTGKEVLPALRDQVVNYKFNDSMFDCTVVAALRFILCFIFYGILGISHWFLVAFTTAGTSTFLIAKVLLYGWTHFGPITFNAMLILMTFALSWGELWFFDFRVVPSEFKTKLNPYSETTPLLGGTGHNNRVSNNVRAYLESNYEASVASFYSPFESPNASDDEVEEDTRVTIPRRFTRRHPLNAEEREYRMLGEETLKQAWFIVNTLDWKLEKSRSNGDTVQSKEINKKKIFLLTGQVNLPPKLLLEELYFKIESVPKWNPTLTECKLIQNVDSHTDISYQVCAEAAGGLVSVRDFVNLRHWGICDGEVYASTGVSIKHPAMPPQHKRIRGENGPGGWFMSPIEGDPDSCKFQWLLDTDLKGWIPKSVIDMALSEAQFEYIGHIREYAKVLRETGMVRSWHERQNKNE